jgi:hypothetical protein
VEPPDDAKDRPASRDFRAWIDGLIDEYDEFAYRYVYDAYLVARDRDQGVYFRAEALPGSESLAIRHLWLREGDEDLIIASEAERREMVAYLDARFGRGRTMNEWHNRAHEGRAEDRF